MFADMLAAFGEWFVEHGAALAIPMTVVSRSADSIRLMFCWRCTASVPDAAMS